MILRLFVIRISFWLITSCSLHVFFTNIINFNHASLDFLFNSYKNSTLHSVKCYLIDLLQISGVKYVGSKNHW